MGALRRPQVEPQQKPEARGAVERRSRPAYPRWLVVSGLILYCTVFWVLIWAAGNWGLDLVRAATAGQP